MTRAEIQQQITKILVETFEVDADEVKLETNLYEDLDLDSIDAIDMFVELSQFTGRRVDPEVARKLRTVEDIIGLVESELAAVKAAQ